MSDLNSISFTGRIVRDAEQKYFASGKPLCTFSVANNTGFGDYTSVQYFKCKIIDKRAESLAQYLTQGKAVGIQGTIEANDWVNKEGKPVHDYQVKVSDIVFLSSGKKEEKQGEMFGEEATPTPAKPNDDDLERKARERFDKAMGKKRFKPADEVTY